MNKSGNYTGINIQHPISQLITSGQKTIETRTYPIPAKYLNVPLVIVETPGKSGKFKSRAIGIVTFKNCFKYVDEKSFYKDFKLHCVDKQSLWKWSDKKPKWGWVIGSVSSLRVPVAISKKKGIVFTKSIKLP